MPEEQIKTTEDYNLGAEQGSATILDVPTKEENTSTKIEDEQIRVNEQVPVIGEIVGEQDNIEQKPKEKKEGSITERVEQMMKDINGVVELAQEFKNTDSEKFKEVYTCANQLIQSIVYKIETKRIDSDICKDIKIFFNILTGGSDKAYWDTEATNLTDKILKEFSGE